MSTKWDKIFEKASRLHGVPAALLRAQVGAESSFDEKAVSYNKAGKPVARGASQFIEKTGNAYGLSSANNFADFFNPEKSIMAQAKYMSDIYKGSGGGDWGVSVAEYNMGPRLHIRGVPAVFSPEGSDRWETAKYTRKILKRSGIESQIGGGQMAKVDPEKALLDYIGQLDTAIKGEDKIMSEYSMGASGAYDASSEDPDVALMRTLAEQLRTEEQALQPSNMAAQLSMIYDPNFAAVFKDATSQRVNAARSYFGNIGTISRQAQSGRSARAQSKKRSGAVLGGLTGQRRDAYRQLAALRQQREEIAQTATQRRQTDKAKPKKPGAAAKVKTHDTAVRLKDARDQLNARRKQYAGTAKERIAENMNLGEMIPKLADSPMGPEMKKEILALQWDVDALQYLYDEEKNTDYTQEDWERAKEITAKRAGLKVPEKEGYSVPGKPKKKDWLQTIKDRVGADIPVVVIE